MLKKIAALLIVTLLAGTAGAWWLHQRLTVPYRGFAGDEVFVDLPSGTGVAEIAERLAGAGVVADPLTFRLAAHLAHVDRRLQAGEYRFVTPATPGEVASRLARGDVFTRVVTFPEGLTVHEMAELFGRSGLGSAAEFEQVASDGSLAAAFDPDAPTLEGYLFPDTYALPRRAGARGTIDAMLARFMHAFDATLRAAATRQRLSLRDVVTIASLVEKETAQPAERPIVSAVYRNRLRIGMALQCDPTVIYALMRADRWHGNLTRRNMQIDSPYNTYRYPGLPPGPIAAPGLASLEAALRPADVPYLYFVSRNDGTHVFATTLAEHNRNVLKWQGRAVKAQH
jgi:UPF0755 protein